LSSELGWVWVSVLDWAAGLASVSGLVLDWAAGLASVSGLVLDWAEELASAPGSAWVSEWEWAR
jgi:hypothetical protein